MKKWFSYSANLAILVGAGALTVSAPDWLSRIIVGVMTAVIFLGELFGVLPLIRYGAGFEHGIRNISERLQCSFR